MKRKSVQDPCSRKRTRMVGPEINRKRKSVQDSSSRKRTRIVGPEIKCILEPEINRKRKSVQDPCSRKRKRMVGPFFNINEINEIQDTIFQIEYGMASRQMLKEY